MATRKVKDIESSLGKKGFRLIQSHHRLYVLYANGKKTSIRTRLSHGAKEYDDHLLGQMAKQVKLTKERLLELIDCPLSEQEYKELLMKAGDLKL
ncbi:hypothetical protein HNO89_000888 [Sporosarcina luteola]|nr:hypothetical protein [Sporosarcina luteola]